jgi:hypothetical protein
VVRMIVWTFAVRSCEEAIQYRKGTGTERLSGNSSWQKS